MQGYLSLKAPMSLISSHLVHAVATAVLACPVCAIAAPDTAGIADGFATCIRSPFSAGPVAIDKGFSAYAIEVGGERYWIALAERAAFVLQSADTGEAVARVKVARPRLRNSMNRQSGANAGWARWRPEPELRWSDGRYQVMWNC